MAPIEFPGLGLTFHIQRVAFQLFGKSIYWYGIIIALGFLLAAIFLQPAGVPIWHQAGSAAGYAVICAANRYRLRQNLLCDL